jgi:hypothetical protein
MSGWTRRFPRTPTPRDLQSLRDAAQDLAAQADRPPVRGGNAFQTVYHVSLLATVGLSGALAGVHLYKTLFPNQREDRHERSPEPVGDQRQPPHHHRLAQATGDGPRARDR